MKTLFKYILAICIALLLSYSENLVANESVPANELEKLKASLTRILQEHKVPGASIAMVDKNGPVWVGAIGKANIENNILADKNTLFRAGSTSKMLVAIAILQLTEKGQLELSDTIKSLIPEISYQNEWHNTDPIRVVHLLEHTTGWDDIHFPEYLNSDPTPLTLKQGLDFHPHSRVSRWQPGTRMSYSNAGPAVAAYIVEKLSGMTFEDYIDTYIFNPLGMRSSTFLYNENVKLQGATLYSGDMQAQTYRHINVRPSGALNASAYDMSKLLMFFINRGKLAENRVLSEHSLLRMESVASTSAARLGQKIGYGLANYSLPYKNWIYRQHNGAIQGGLSDFSYLPEEKLGHSIMINSDNYLAMRQISNAISEYETRNLPIKKVKKEIDVQAVHKTIEGVYYKINNRTAMFEFANLLQLQQFYFEGEQLVKKSFFGGKASHYFPVSDNMYKSAESGVTALTLVNDPFAGPVIHSGTKVLKPINQGLVYIILLIGVGWLITIVVTVLYACFCIVRQLRGQQTGKGISAIQLFPILASLMIILIVTIIKFFAVPEPVVKPDIISLALTGLTYLFAIFSISGFLISVFNWSAIRSSTYNKVFFSFAVSHSVMALYFSYFGVIGLQIWS